MAPGCSGPLPEWSDQSPPIQLVTFDKTSKGSPQLVVREEGRSEILKATGKNPIRAVAVCGVYRSGKSFLLNLLAGTQGKGNFAVGDSVCACTAGLWVRASRPAAEDGSVCLLLDCEGSGNTERDKDHDARLFALVVLVSSLLVFNSRGVISDTAVQALALAASLAQHIHRQHEALAQGINLSPAFLWVLRDFALVLEDTSGKPITAGEYLEQMLGRFSGVTQPPPGTFDTANWTEKREAREKILELFPERDCATLVRPVDEEDDLQRLAELPVERLRPKFAAQVSELRKTVFQGCPVLKSPSGEEATGGAFLALVQAHVEAMNAGSTPNLGNTWQHIQQQECSRAVEEGLHTFSTATLDLASSLPVADGQLEEALAQAKAGAVRKFNEVAMGDKATRAAHEKELRDGLEDGAARLLKENQAIATGRNEAWIQERWATTVEDPLRSHRAQFDADELGYEECLEAEASLKSHLAELEAAYWQAAVGSREAYEEPWERIVAPRREAANREVAAWKSHAFTTAEAKRAAAKAAKEERARLEAEGDALYRKAAEEVEKSKKRMAGRAKSGAKSPQESGGPGQVPKCCTVM